MPTTGVGTREGLGERLTQGAFSYVFVSVALVVLIIAFVTTPSHTESRSYSLPGSTTAEAFVAAGGINLVITERGDFVVDGTWVPEPNFDRFILARLAENRSAPVSIAVDGKLKYSVVREMAQRLSGLGVSRLFLVTGDNKLKVFSAAWSSEDNV